jgi:GT2 family glycosyltransferase
MLKTDLPAVESKSTGEGALTPTVAVVIPVHNSLPFLDETLRSVMQQTCEDFTCLIVDDGSIDDTAVRAQSVVAGDSRFRLITQNNAGVSAARNRGAAESQSEFLAFFDHDDLWDARFLEVLLRALGEHSDAPAVHCVAEGISATGSPKGHFAEWSRARRQAHNGRLVSSTPGPTTFEALVTAPCIVSPGAGLIRRSSFDGIGGFDPNLRIAEDWDVWIKLSRIGALTFVDESLFFYRQHGQNTHVHDWRSRRDTSHVRRRSISHPANSPRQADYARQAARTFYHEQGRELLRASGPKSWPLGLLRMAYAHTF